MDDQVSPERHEGADWSKPQLQIRGPHTQAYGSALTYARRYSLASMVGVVTEDDDG
ncbi:MAG: hypothetical protein EBR82_36895, partial [Caulobacteraceae bacterium]|nr:hypothetical protein [Caulobacteraceae bacterium]